MARRRGVSRGFIRPPARTKIWVGAGLVPLAMPASTKTLQGTYSAGILSLRPFTILRTRFDIFYSTDQGAATETPLGTYAEIIVTETAAALGVTAVPNPSSVDGDPDQDWYVYQGMNDDLFFATSAGFEKRGHHYIVDSKAMRKVGPSDDLAVVTDQQNAVGATLHVLGRQLIQLH